MRTLVVFAFLLAVAIAQTDESVDHLQECDASAQKCGADMSTAPECLQSVMQSESCQAVLTSSKILERNLGREFLECQMNRLAGKPCLPHPRLRSAPSRNATHRFSFAPSESFAMLGDYSSLCMAIARVLPSFCAVSSTCKTTPSVVCTSTLFSDTLRATASLNLCKAPVSASLNIKDTFFGVNWSKVISASATVPVPGLSFKVPAVGSLGAFVEVSLYSGTMVGASIAVEACGSVMGFNVCYPDPAFELFSFDFASNSYC